MPAPRLSREPDHDAPSLRPPLGSAGAQPHLGNQLRAIRTAQRKTIAEVAEATEISASFLSLVEKGRSDISIGRLMRLTAYYGVGLADVLPHEETGAIELIRAGEHRVLPSDDERMEISLLTSEGGRAMRPILASYEPGGGTSDPIHQEGDVFLYVLEGEITVDTLNGEPVVLCVGDTLYLESGTPRRYENRGTSRAMYLGVLSQPERANR